VLAEHWEQMLVQLVAMLLESSLPALACFHAALIALGPPARHTAKAKLWRRQTDSKAGRIDKRGSLHASLVEVVADGPKARTTVDHEADGVLAVGLPVDPALDPDAMLRPSFAR